MDIGKRMLGMANRENVFTITKNSILVTGNMIKDMASVTTFTSKS